MKSLKDAERQILLQCPQFSIAKQNNTLNDDDYISIIDCIKKDKDFMKRVIIENKQHLEKLVKDKSVIKRYFSSEMPSNLKYLALMSLGIEWLNYSCQIEDMREGMKILDEKVNEEKEKLPLSL
jgi:hypothetical protein